MIRLALNVFSIAVILGCFSLVSCSQSKDPAASPAGNVAAARLFAYDRNAAIDVAVDTVRAIDGVTVLDAHFASCSPRHGAVKFYLVRPAGNGPFAGIFFFHWLGRPRGDREEFLDEAVQLAKRGTLCLLIQGYFPWNEDPIDGPTDRQQVIDQTIDARRGLDLLLRQPGVDSQRIGYVGHDYGAMFGSIIAGLDSCVKTYVFVAGMGNFGDWSLKYWPATAKGGEKPYREALDAVDPIHFVPDAAPASVLFQFSAHDKYITKDVAEAFSSAASHPKTIRWYDAQHDMGTVDVAKDRQDWLIQHLNLAKP
jgi:dienelactone hydrolase